MKKRLVNLAIAALALSGCATSKETFGPDGRSAYAINCSGAALSWDLCFKKAGDICNVSGYDTISVNGQAVGTVVTASPNTGLFAVPVVERVMVVSCKKPTPAPSPG